MEEQSKIVDFFKNQTIFITGGTGFVGKLLIEKLLRVCYHLNAIYIIVRPKRNKSPEERFEEIFKHACFDKLKGKHPNFLEKVRLVAGDCEKTDLGLSLENLEILKREVTIVVDSSANVKFNQSLRSAAGNVKSVKHVLTLVKEIAKLKSFIYVSTAYSNYSQTYIEEKFYQPGMSPEMLFDLVDNFDDETLESITPSILKKTPNTYIFTKCIAEELIRREFANLPVVIVRPGIILPTHVEPVRCWVDNLYGFGSVSLGSMMGVIKVIHGKRNVHLHPVPCDFVVNFILASIWDYETRKEPTIYNFTGSEKNLLPLGEMVDYHNELKWKWPVNISFWFPILDMEESERIFRIRLFLQHTLMAYVADFVLTCMGRERLAVNKIRKINEQLLLISYFTIQALRFETTNVDSLWSRMNQLDKKIFRFNTDTLNWKDFYENCYKYSRIYLLKERLEDLQKAKRKLVVLAVIHYTLMAAFWYLVYVLLKKIVFSFI